MQTRRPSLVKMHSPPPRADRADRTRWWRALRSDRSSTKWSGAWGWDWEYWWWCRLWWRLWKASAGVRAKAARSRTIEAPVIVVRFIVSLVWAVEDFRSRRLLPALSSARRGARRASRKPINREPREEFAGLAGRRQPATTWLPSSSRSSGPQT